MKRSVQYNFIYQFTIMKKSSLALLLFLAACTTTRQSTTNITHSNTVVDGKLFATAFQQRAAEYKALCYQAFNFARLRLEQIPQVQGSKPGAIITDIDETVLDNSAYEASQVLQGKDYESATWKEWTAKGIADTVPGAPHFLRYAASRGIEIFYITNRDENERQGTLQNLKRYNLPNADNNHLILRQGISSKEGRRKEIEARFNVLLLLGDNLADFTDLFDKPAIADRDERVKQLAGVFGQRFILLPNPVYGDWESALYQYKSGLTLAQKDSVLRSAIRGY